MATGEVKTEVDDTDHTETIEDDDDKGKTFRKRRLSLTNLRQLESDCAIENDDDDDDDDDCDDIEGFPNIPLFQKELGDSSVNENEIEDKAQTFRKRRLSLTLKKKEDADEHEAPTKRHRKASDASVSSQHSSGASGGKMKRIESIILHASEIASPSPSHSSSLPKFYQKAAPPQQQLSVADEPGEKTPKWKERHHADDNKSLPFPRNIVGTFSCHGVEPIYEDSYFYLPMQKRPTMAAKINQDRGGVAFPYGNSTKTALFAVYDGHGQGGELVSQYSLNEMQRLLEKHPDFNGNIEKAFKDTFLKVNSSLKDEELIEPTYAGTTACVALLRDKQLILSNAGDSRAVMARKMNGGEDDAWDVIDLTQDQNPDLPSEKERIERMGGFVSPPPEPGLSSRVWLDAEWSQIGLAMARSIGDYAVKPVGVIAEPVVSFHDLHENDNFFILATDGVWEFISSAEAVNIVSKHLHMGATKACQVLIETAAAKWHDEEGDYRDDITALVVRVQDLFKPQDTK